MSGPFFFFFSSERTEEGALQGQKMMSYVKDFQNVILCHFYLRNFSER